MGYHNTALSVIVLGVDYEIFPVNFSDDKFVAFKFAVSDFVGVYEMYYFLVHILVNLETQEII